ncbi:PREDICTED: LOW QUALITY PROTEIN: protein FAM53B [Pygoscelis adeliae]|uniref:LOW QUALITY PROTEIN: protein FAM53B n=1 Tax=Pygoscelis adeliae TaxID=9238 RepID=UPI0004F4FE92|nr:PREDICTED: LOW QUALITY PROTEIN: protein FAM53B [Pygoscelis adeliae]
MVMILTKTRENKGADSVTCRTELHTPKMSQGPTLFSCGVMGNDCARERRCHIRKKVPGMSIYSCLCQSRGERGSPWPLETASTCSVTNLIKDLSLSDPHGNPSAPPSKRQCRSLSFSDEMSSCGTLWRPLGSKVWTPVEKRPSAPSRSNPLSCEHPALSSRLGCQLRKSATGGHGGDRVDMQRSLSCSHDRFSSSEYGSPSASSTPASTPELERRAGGLSRSRSQPCVLNDKKVGVKRRRPEEVQEQRPSLDLAKMTQNRQTFNSLTCLSAAAEDGSQQLPGPQPWTVAPRSPDVMPGRTPACTPVPEPPRSRADERQSSRDDLSCEEEEEGGGKEEDGVAWRSGGGAAESLFQLDGEIDIEQIENN